MHNTIGRTWDGRRHSLQLGIYQREPHELFSMWILTKLGEQLLVVGPAVLPERALMSLHFTAQRFANAALFQLAR